MGENPWNSVSKWDEQRIDHELSEALAEAERLREALRECVSELSYYERNDMGERRDSVSQAIAEARVALGEGT